MEPEYLDKVHGIMQGVYGDKFTLDVDTFKDKMINETQYRDKIYGIMQGVYGDKFTLDPKTFYNKVLESSKKKSQSEIGSQATQPTDGSESVQFSPQGLRPEDQQVQEEQQVSEQPKRVIQRGEGTREALETQFAPQVKQEIKKATVTEATKPIAKEMGEVIKPASKIQKLADLNYMNENPDDFNSTYYNVFKDEAEKSGDPEKYSKDLKDKYANDFIDEEFKEEFNIANELKYIEDKMKKEISSLKSNPNANTPQGQEYIKNKIAEYTQLIQSKASKLDEVRKANNQKYQQRIDEIDNLFKTGEAVMREDALNSEKNELMRRMKLIKLAENPEGLKQEVGDVEYNKIPGATADEKLNNYLNTRLTIYDQFKEDALDAALDRNRFYGQKKERADKVYNSYLNLKGELKDLYYLSALKRYANPEDRSNFLQAAGEGFLGGFAEGALNFDDVGKKHSDNLQKIAQEAGIQYGDEDKSFIEYTSEPAKPWSSEWWGNMTGTSSAFMAELALTRKPTNAVLKAAGSAIKAAPQMTKIAQGALSRYDKLGKTGQKFVNTVFNAAEEGAYFEGANQILHDGESSELTFLTGLTGGLLAAPVNALLKKTGGLVFDSFKKGATQEITKDALTAERAAVLESLGAQKDEVKTLLSQFVKPTAGKDAVYMISGTFGKQSPKVIDLLEKVGTHLIARPTGEVAQEFGEELANIYQDTSNFEEFKKEFSARFPDADAATQFVVASYMMGVGFGGGNFIGDVFMKKSKQGYDALTPEQKKVADKAIAEADKEIKDKESEVLNEQELNAPKKEKTKEEADWENTRTELEGKISQSDSQISALENIKQKIYEKYGITDPKTQDISALSNEDAIKIETINSEIQKEKKVKSKEEINLSIHDDNKPVIEEAEEAPNAVHADQLIDKNKQDAVQEPSSESVLPREQGETTETGGEPQGMGPSVQGEEVTQEGQEVSQEGVEATKPISQKIIDSRMNDLKKRLESSLEFAKANNIPEDKSPDVASAREQIAKLESNPAAYLEELYNFQKDQPLDAKYISDLKQAVEELKSTGLKSKLQEPNLKELSNVEETAKALEGLADDKFTQKEQETTPTARDVNYGDITWQPSEISSFNIASNGKTYITDKDGEIYQISKNKLKQNDTYLITIKDKNGNNEVGNFEFIKNKDGSYSSNESYVTKKRKGLASIAYDYLSEEGVVIKPSKKLKKDGVKFWSKSIAKAYHKAKEDGSNPELVDAVEELLGKKEKTSPTEQVTEQVTEQAQEVTSEKLSDEDKKYIDSISNDLEEYLKNNPEQYFPGEKKDGKVNVKVKGGLLDIRAAALNSDKRKSVPTPTSLPFLPKIINLKHLARNKSDKKSILKNGFNENQVSLDSAIPGIYFSSDDWSTMGRFDRSTKDSLFASIENEGLIYFDSANEFADFLKENNLPFLGRRLTKDQVDFLRSNGIKGILLREDYASGERNELIVIDKSIIKDVSESEKEITDVPSSFVEPKSISKAYYLAKKNNSNPELVDAVEKAIGEKSINKNEEVKPTVETQETEQEVAPEEEAKVVEEASKNEGIKPKNMQDLIGIYRKVFGLSFPKAVSAAMVSNRLVKQMAKRAGVTPEQMYQRLSFQQITEQQLKGLSKKGKLLKQIVGENSNLDQGIKDNLDVAKDMDKSGKTPKQIRLITGWEKGPDGKWRYEVVDPSLKFSSFAQLNDIIRASEKTMGGYVRVPLSKLMNGLEFGETLRNKISDMQVYFDNSIPIGQAYYQNGGININPYSAIYNENFSKDGAFDNFKGILLHEIQHHIQIQEGFAEAFSPEGYKFDIDLAIEKANDELESAKRISEFNDSYKDRIKPLEDKLNSLKEKRDNLTEDQLDEMYWLSYGEVEARNVQARMNMTPDQRKQLLLSETEDVSRNKSILFTEWMDSLMTDGVKLLFSQKKRQEYKSMLEKKRPDLVRDGLIDKVINQVEKFGKDNSQNGQGNPKLEKLALYWIYNANVILPEDGYKIIDAEKVASKNKVDPFSYSSPDILLDVFKDSIKEKPINPDTIKEFTNKKEIPGTGITVYNVKNTKEGMEAVRRIIDTHLGKDSNPWCLAARVNGDLNEAWILWKDTYNGIDKKIAFKNGKLIAFKAEKKTNQSKLSKLFRDEQKQTWWDRFDQPSEGISTTIDLEDGKKQYIYINENSNNSIQYGDIISETKSKIQRWNSKGQILSEVNLKNGLNNGESLTWYDNGVLRSRSTYIDGLLNGDSTLWDENGNVATITPYKDSMPDGVMISFHNGKISHEISFKDGLFHGPTNYYDNLGNLKKQINYDNGSKIGDEILFQKDSEKARGAMMISKDGKAIIYALTDPNISTPLHELAHVFEHYLTDAEKNQIIKAAKTKGWTTETSEYFARGFEKYLAEGKSNNPIFEKFKQFLLDVYKAIKGSPIDVKLNKAMKAIYAEMLGEDITQGEAQEEVEVETDTELESIINEFKAAQQMEGIDKLDKMNELKEKYGEIYEKMTFIDSNVDELVEKFNAIRICNFEI